MILFLFSVTHRKKLNGKESIKSSRFLESLDNHLTACLRRPLLQFFLEQSGNEEHYRSWRLRTQTYTATMAVGPPPSTALTCRPRRPLTLPSVRGCAGATQHRVRNSSEASRSFARSPPPDGVAVTSPQPHPPQPPPSSKVALTPLLPWHSGALAGTWGAWWGRM